MLVILALVLSSVVCTNCLVVLRHGNDHATKTFLPQSRCLSRFNRKTQSRLRAEHYFTEYDKYGTEKLVQFDPKSGTLQSVQAETEQQEAKSNKLAPLLFSSFIPTGDLSPDYYRFSAWRVVQRLIGSTNNVFGTQALLLALGLRKDKIGLAAASSWVLKDALGKVSRIVFASKFGRRFDVDTKKWRFRASLLYSLGTALEILTFLFPSFFIISAAIATAFKQMAMLSNSSTRNAIYKSFSRNADNIGDITAKGEAQIAVIDIFGLALGITIAKVMNQSRWRVIAAFVLLSALDFLAVYREIRSVVFNTLNYERANLVLSELIPLLADPPSPMISSTLSPPPSPASQLDNPSSATVMPSPEEIRISSDDKTDIGKKKGIARRAFSAVKNAVRALRKSKKTSDTPITTSSSTSTSPIIPALTPNATTTSVLSLSPETRARLSPTHIAQREELLRPAQPGESVFSTFSMLLGEKQRSSSSTASLTEDPALTLSFSLSEKFRKKFLFTFDVSPVAEGWRQEGVKGGMERRWVEGGWDGGRKVIRVQEKALLFTPRILLHKDATHTDIFQAWVILNKVMCDLQQVGFDGREQKAEYKDLTSSMDYNASSSSLVDLLQRAYAFENYHHGSLLRLLEEGGWETKRWAFGSQKIRVKW